jgi:ATP-dependent protease HslVU (ClpYQ) peptidase subunit
MRIDYAIQTSERTRNRLELLENWTRHVQKPSTVRFVSDEQVGRGDYLSAIDKTVLLIDTFQPHYDWLYIVDDDGYVVPRRLELRLIDLDPDEHHAIGCVQGVLSNDTHKFPAIHGGCGYALSRATALALQQRHWHGELVRHHRSSDGTVAINLHHMRVIPEHDDRFTSSVAKEEDTGTFIACHRVIPHPEHLIHLPRLNSAQLNIVEASEAKPNKIEEFSQNAVKSFV